MDDSILPGQRLRARGADSNRAGRFAGAQRAAFADGWDIPALRTDAFRPPPAAGEQLSLF